MPAAPRQTPFDATLAAVRGWAADPNVLGVLQVGSKSRGHGDARSDDDLEVLLTDAAFAALAPAECHTYLLAPEGALHPLVYDAQFLPRSDLARKAGSTADLDHWPYERAGILFDRDGGLAPLVAAAAAMPAGFRRARIQHGAIDAAVHARRAQKTAERGYSAATRALVGRSAAALVRVVFALEGRWAPLDHWLEPELATLERHGPVTDGIVVGLRDGDPAALLEVLAALGEPLEAAGVPRDRKQWTRLFLELIHPSRADERRVHG